MSIADYVAALFPLSEILIALKRRAKEKGTVVDDRGSLRRMWQIILISIGVAVVANKIFPHNILEKSISDALALGLLFMGMAIRWYSIIYLGKYFTVNVAIVADHQLVQSGPYKYVRHPSYAGLLIAFLGLGILNNNWLGLLSLTVPVFLAIAYRIKVEEAVMLAEFVSYQEYVRRTKKLIPFVY